MRLRTRQDVVGGFCVAAVGLAAAVHSAASYDIGTPAAMGPGFFPVSLGVVLVGLGALIGLFGWRSGPADLVIEVKPLAAVLAAIAVFALTAPVLGLLPAVVLLVLVSLLADEPVGMVPTLLITGAIAAVAVLIFRVGLKTPLPVVAWPF